MAGAQAAASHTGALAGSEAVYDAIFKQTQSLTSYRIDSQGDDIDLSNIGRSHLAGMQVDVVDPVSDYQQLIKRRDAIQRFREHTAQWY